MKLLFLDFESQSDDPLTTNPTEVGAILVDSESGEVEEKLSKLIYSPSYPPQTDEIIDITGITDEMLKKDGNSPRDVFNLGIFPLVLKADYIVAHNAAFDRGVYESTAHRLDLSAPQPKMGWICSLNDIQYPKKYKCKKLSHLAYDHGILVDPSTLHRAINDVELLALLFGKYKLDEIIAYRDTPWLCLAAQKIYAPWEDGGITTGQAKKLGYSWERIFGTDLVFSKKWVKRIKETELEAEKAKCPFPVFILPDKGGKKC